MLSQPSTTNEKLCGFFESIVPESVSVKMVCPKRHTNKFQAGKLFLTCESCKRFCRVKAERKISAVFVGKEGVRDLEIPGDILTITDDKSDEEIMQEILTGEWSIHFQDGIVLSMNKVNSE